MITPAGRDAMEAATAELVEARFGLAMLSAEEHEQLFDLLRKVRVGAHDFDA